MDFEFKEKLETGVPWQDREHKELYKRIKALIEAVERHDGPAEVIKLLDFLDDYVVEHFHDEEQAMSKVDYPDMLTHLGEHTVFIDELAKIKDELEHGVTAGLIDEVQDQVARWFENHVIKTDKVLGAFLIKAASPTG